MRNFKRIFKLIILMLLIILNISFAQDEIQIISDKSVIEKDEEVRITINIKDTEIAALRLEIYWDSSKLEYINGPENSNNLNNRILYTWVSENGQNSNEVRIETFNFKAIADGITSIAVIGDFYNSNGDKIEIESNNLEIKIGKEDEKTVIINEQNKNITNDNTDLSILRLNHEGISPDFDKDIKEYYFVTTEAIQNLEITAIPENSEANVTITGNNKLQMGENTIDIKVESKDKTKSSTYKIYLTKTQNLETANANLETLAVREASLEPEFDSNMTHYKLEIASDINRIDILAIPQRENATVDISGNEEMQVGDNKIEVNVLAENRTTGKKYEILVHRRNEEEEIAHKKEEEYQTERLSAIIEEEQNQDKVSIEQKNENTSIIVTIIGISIIIIVVIIYKYKTKWKYK